MQLRETGGRVEVLDDPEPGVACDGPLVVLVDRFSASASEIFAAAIQDYGRGLVVGQQTYGKGSVQNLYPLDRYALGPDPGFGQLTVTIGKYYRVTGESTQHRGVQPDIAMPTAISTEEVGESTRESALPWDRIRPVDFGKRSAAAARRSPTLEHTHEERIAADPDFRCWSPISTRSRRCARRRSCRSTCKTRIGEREQLEKERLARENERRTARGLQPLRPARGSQWRRASRRRARRDDGDRGRPEWDERPATSRASSRTRRASGDALTVKAARPGRLDVAKTLMSLVL